MGSTAGKTSPQVTANDIRALVDSAEDFVLFIDYVLAYEWMCAASYG
jgi:hypothetical protein